MINLFSVYFRGFYDNFHKMVLLLLNLSEFYL